MSTTKVRLWAFGTMAVVLAAMSAQSLLDRDWTAGSCCLVLAGLCAFDARPRKP